MQAKRRIWAGLGAFMALALAMPTPAGEPAQVPAPSPAGPLRVAIAGRVVDAAGHPVAGARLSNFWNFDDANPEGRPAQRLDSDVDGAFQGELQLAAPGPFALVAYSADGAQAGLVRLASGADLSSVALRLEPAVRVRGQIASPALGHAVPWTNVFWTLAGSDLTVAGAASIEARIDLSLPAGRYAWFAYGEQVQSSSGEVTLGAAALTDASSREHDLGTIEIAPTFLALNRGKTLPAWHVSEARGVPLEQATLEALRGRWLLVAFFGYRSGPALLVELPKLIQFHETSLGTPRAERFRLVAFHDESLPSLKAVDEAMASVRERVWGGRTIPFPLLIDATGQTFDTYGIQSLPTLVLIDPDGKLVGEATLEDLIAALEREEAEAEPRDGQGPPREER